MKLQMLILASLFSGCCIAWSMSDLSHHKKSTLVSRETLDLNVNDDVLKKAGETIASPEEVPVKRRGIEISLNISVATSEKGNPEIDPGARLAVIFSKLDIPAGDKLEREILAMGIDSETLEEIAADAASDFEVLATSHISSEYGLDSRTLFITVSEFKERHKLFREALKDEIDRTLNGINEEVRVLFHMMLLKEIGANSFGERTMRFRVSRQSNKDVRWEKHIDLNGSKTGSIFLGAEVWSSFNGSSYAFLKSYQSGLPE